MKTCGGSPAHPWPNGPKPKAKRAPRLCSPCANGVHPNTTHGEIGCLKVLSREEKLDFVCDCIEVAA